MPLLDSTGPRRLPRPSPFRFRTPDAILASARRPLEREEEMSRALDNLESLRFRSPSHTGRFVDRFAEQPESLERAFERGDYEALSPFREPAREPLAELNRRIAAEGRFATPEEARSIDFLTAAVEGAPSSAVPQGLGQGRFVLPSNLREALQLGREATTSLAPPEALERVGEVPVVGPALEREAAALSTPLGLAFLGRYPALMGLGALGGVTAGTAG